MDNHLSDLLQNFQVRKTYQQKTDFIHWMEKQCDKLGYEVKIQQHKKCRNIVIGNLAESKVILSAHYDTPPNALIPLYTCVGNLFSGILSQIALAALIYLPFTTLHVYIRDSGHVLLSFIPLLLMLAYLLQMSLGKPNKHNKNDNTSGVATILSAMYNIPESNRNKVCFVLFDEEETGLNGSGNFASIVKEQIVDTPLINFDCVGNGENLLFISRKRFRESSHVEWLESACKDTHNMARFLKASSTFYPSDQLNFKYSCGVVAAKKLPIIGYYIGPMHSRWDNKLDENNIIKLNSIICSYIESLE